MPNWVINRVTVSGKESNIKKFADKCLNKEVGGDFVPFSLDRVIRMPKSLNIESLSRAKWGMEYLLADDEKKAEMMRGVRKPMTKRDYNKTLSLGRKALKNVEKYGFPTWYEWRLKNWGTKWDVSDCDAEISPTSVLINFQTAWSTPFVALQTMSKKFKVDVCVEYADEDLGSNCGVYNLSNGELVCEESRDFDFACDMWGYDPEDFEDED